MSAARRSFFLVFCAASILWASLAILAQSVRIEHRGLLAMIRSGPKEPEPAMLSAAIADYERNLRAIPCHLPLHRDLMLLLAQRTDTAMQHQELSQTETLLDAMQATLASLLSCSPTDGKAWLDFAMIHIHREGFTKHALGAYEMSARVAPGESWLAEKRLLFALDFLPLLDANLLKIVSNDLAVLALAHPNRMELVMDTANVESVPALYALFNLPTP